MHELTDRELYEAIEYARNIDEETGQSIMQKFQVEQPALAQTIFNVFPSLIAQQSQEMAHMFMELCFDTLCVYQHVFGDVPAQTEEWLERQMSLLDVELQSLIPNQQMDEKIRVKLKDRFTERAYSEVTQLRLVEVMNESIDEYASESTGRVASVKITQNMMFTMIRLLSNLYSQTAENHIN